MKTPRFARSRSRGFTLIELLVVVAIIGLLISILLPSLDGARRSARQLLCVTNLRTQGEAFRAYQEANKEWVVRGIGGVNDFDEWGHYSTSLLKHLPYYDKSFTQEALWNVRLGTKNKNLLEALRAIPQYQCPDHPTPWNPFDYVSSAFAYPYTKAAADVDVAGGGWAGEEWQGVGVGTVPYIAEFNMNEWPDKYAPSRFILATEAHASLAHETETDEKGDWVRYHSVFLTSQLPFGLYPRIASDRRHPGGINALFFDGSARNMPLSSIDPGYGQSIGIRLRWFAPTEDPALQ